MVLQKILLSHVVEKNHSTPEFEVNFTNNDKERRIPTSELIVLIGIFMVLDISVLRRWMKYK